MNLCAISYLEFCLQRLANKYIVLIYKKWRGCGSSDTDHHGREHGNETHDSLAIESVVSSVGRACYFEYLFV